MNAEYIVAALGDNFKSMAGRQLESLEVAVLDSGIDATHPDLADRVIESFIIDQEADRVKVSRIQEKHNNDAYGHGTGVASIIARIAPHVKIVDIRILGADNKGAGSALVEGLRIAIKRKSRLINMSLAATVSFAQNLFPLCEKAYYQNQVIVASKRNMPLADMGFPAEFSNCISVDNKAFVSPYEFVYRPDTVIEYAANGEEVVVAAAGGGYTTMTGTSFAAPTVSGLCALILGAYPALRPFELKTILKAYAVTGI